MIDEKAKLETCLLSGFVLISKEESEEAVLYMPCFRRWFILALGHCWWRKPQDDWLSARPIWNFLTRQRNVLEFVGIWPAVSQMTIDIRQVAKTTVFCTRTIKGMLSQRTTSVHFAFQMFPQLWYFESQTIPVKSSRDKCAFATPFPNH